MQLIKTQRDVLLRPLQIVNGIVGRRHTLPILANILIRINGKQVDFLSTDIEIQITTHATIGCCTVVEYATTVAARKFLDILRSLSNKDEILITLFNTRFTIQSGKSRFSLQTLAAEEFPIIAEVKEYNATITLSQKMLKYLLSTVYFAMAQQDIRYYLNGLLLVIEEKHIMVVATDGHRLAFNQVKIDETFQNKKIIIPRKTIIELQRLLEEEEDIVKIKIADNQVKLNFANIELISKLVEGKFPDFTRLIPQGYQNNFTMRRDQLLRSLQRTSIMVSDKFKGVRWVVSPYNLKISSTNIDQEEAIEELNINYNNDKIDIGFNVTYLLDVLNNLKSDYIDISLSNAHSSALITIPNNTNFKYVVMPMRI